MKLIDILLDIANGKAVPVKIKVYNDIYEYDTFNKLYWNKQHKNLLELYNGYILTYEVEIIEDTPEENKKIEKLDLHYTSQINDSFFKKEILAYCDNLQYKINEIIDKINGGEQ